MHLKIQPIHDLLQQAYKQLNNVKLDDVDPENEYGYEDVLNDADAAITEAKDLLETIV